ncbi:hypothetical protein WA026_014675 [Henosepilachna vigintioctopunctata]|uniref:Uncharacterized protein n=1 Tax=Henosepilachna vigintioctopunctata TaxID=420089 RepID=A0AAW1VE57_9CUCU
MSSNSDSESVNENSNNNDISDSELSTYSNSSWRKAEQSSSTNGDNFESNGRNGMKRSSEETDEADFLNQQMYSNEKDVAKYSTQEVGYSYLHSNLSLND